MQEVLEPTDWGRYHDDTWDIEASELANPANILRFTGHLIENICKGKIIFEPNNDPKELTFLDTKVYLEDGYLKPVIYSKSTDVHRYLDPASCHPRKVTRAIPLSVGLRVRRICSDNFANDKIFVDKLQAYKGYLLDCNYEEEQVNRAFLRHLELRGIRYLMSNKKWAIRVNQKLTLSKIMTRGFPISIGFSVNINISLRTTINVEFYFHRTVLGSHIGEDIGTLKNG